MRFAGELSWLSAPSRQFKRQLDNNQVGRCLFIGSLRRQQACVAAANHFTVNSRAQLLPLDSNQNPSLVVGGEQSIEKARHKSSSLAALDQHKMSDSSVRPSVTITTYSTLKRIERQQKQPNQLQESATRSELSTAFFKVNPGGCGASASEHNQRNRQNHHLERGRVLIDLSQIKGPTGSVRGHKNVVRRSLEGIKMAYNRRSNFNPSMATAASLVENRTKFLSAFTGTGSCSNMSLANNYVSKYSPTNSLNSGLYCLEYLERLAEDEQNLCVAYTTTLGVIRRTFDNSKIMKSILNLNLINFEERDIYLNQEYKLQLRFRLDSIRVPALFVDGQYIGGVEELEVMNENGELKKLLSKFKMSKASVDICSCCGNAKFIACPSCNGSRKSTIHHFKYNSIALRCIKCDKNDGLVMCPVCCYGSDHQTSDC